MEKMNSEELITSNTPANNNIYVNNAMPNGYSNYNNSVISNSYNNKTRLRCTKCNGMLGANNKFCPHCGAPSTNSNGSVPTGMVNNTFISKVMVTAANYDNIYRLPESKMIEEFIKRELVKSSVDLKSKLIPQDALKRKKVLNIFFSVLVFVYISLIFFHFPIFTYVIGLFILIVFYVLTRRFNLVKYLVKQVKARPSEKISGIVMNTRNSLVIDNSTKSFLLTLCGAIILPLLIFLNPRTFYEKVDNGYFVRFYTFGVTNFTSATIEDTYKNEPVIGLRGNTFSNMFFLREVYLPDSITEIRGQAFKNDINLTLVKLPNKLEYLGGGAFYRCKSLTSIEIPDTVTYMGGETFYGCSSLEKVKLSNKLQEIRGNTFEECTSLKMIIIPDSVTRIGGHAFYGCTSLQSVSISETSQLKEIGSSAFRLCDNLYSIKLPVSVSVNTRAFKESPTKIERYGSQYNK